MIKSNDKKIRELQIARDKSDDNIVSTAWFGKAIKKYKRRAECLEQCHIYVYRAMHSYPSLSFVNGDGQTSIYGSQSFYLRNQWESGGDYWYGDAGIHGVLDTDEFLESEQLQKLQEAVNPSGGEDFPEITLTPFTDEEHGVIQECVVPFVMRLDEAFSQQRKSLEDYGYKLSKKEEHGMAGNGYELYRQEVKGVDRTLKLRMFKALHLLSIHAF